MKRKRQYKYRRLNCTAGNKQCGSVCIAKDDTCHKGKAALVKANVKKEIKRLEEGKPPGSITNKAMARLLLEDKDIGQKLPKEMSPYIASSDKIDDRVKKAYFSSATRRSWNIDGTHGSRPSIKLKKQDEEFARMINNRAVQHNVQATNVDEEGFTKKAKNFFRTKKGKKVLKLIGATASVGAAAAIATYYVKSQKPKDSDGTDGKSALDVANESYKKSEAKISVLEDRVQNKLERGERVPSRISDDPDFVTSSAAEVYANTYSRATHMETKVGDEMSTREQKDYEAMWGYKPGERKGRKATEGSTLGKAERELEDRLRDQVPSITKEEIASTKATLQIKGATDKSKNLKQRRRDPETGEMRAPRYTDTTKYEEENNLDLSSTSRREQKLREEGIRKELNRDGTTYEQDRFQQSTMRGKGASSERIDIDQLDSDRQKDEGIFSGVKQPRATVEDRTELNAKQRAAQQKQWSAMSEEDKLALIDAKIYNDASDRENYAGEVIDGTNIERRDKARNYIKEKLADIYQETHLNALRDQKLTELKNSIIAGTATLPEYRSQASSMEEVTSGRGGAGQQDDYFRGEEMIGTSNADSGNAKNVKQRELAAIEDNDPFDIRKGTKAAEKYKREETDEGIIITDLRGKKFRKDGSKYYVWSKKGRRWFQVPGENRREILSNMTKKGVNKFTFSESQYDINIHGMIEWNGNVVIMETDTGVMSAIFDEENETFTIVEL